MALMIRLRQQGRRNAHTFRLVVTDKKSPRDGKYIESLGWYNPQGVENKELFIHRDKVQFWIDRGAIMSEKAQALVKRFSPDMVKDFLRKNMEKKLQSLAKKKKKKKSAT